MEDSLRNCLADLEVALFIKDLDGRYMAMDERGARMVGRPVDQILGRDDNELFERSDAGLIMVRDRFILNRRGPLAYESLAQVSATGEIQHFQSIKVPLRNGPRETLSGLLGLSFVSRVGRAELERETRTLMGFLAHRRTDRLLPLLRRQSRLIV